MMDRRNVIYALIDPVTNFMRYIGLSTYGLDRCRAHINDAKNERHGNQHLSNWINKLIKQELAPEFEIIEEFNNEYELGEAEKFWIYYFKSIGCPLLNIREGGSNGLLSEETKKKIGEKSKGRFVSEETRKKVGVKSRGNKNNLGRKMSQEQKDKIRTKLQARKLSEEHKKRIGQAHEGRVFSEEHQSKLKITRQNMSQEWRENIGKSKKGKRLTQEHKDNIRLGAKRDG